MTLVVSIDAGHGGPGNYGTMWPPFERPADWPTLSPARRAELIAAHAAGAELVEKAATLQLARDLALSLRGLPTISHLTRADDSGLELETRAAFAAKNGADVAISLHVNAMADPATHGSDVFHWPSDQTGLSIATAIASAMPLGLRTMRIHPATVQWERVRNVLAPHHEQHGRPAVLVECYYASSARDRAYGQSAWGRAAIVTALRAGVCRAGELLAPPREPPG